MAGKVASTTGYEKLWKSFEEVERNIVLFLVHATPPTSLDALISLSGASAVQVVNVMERLKDRKIVCEKKGYGKGIYFLNDGEFARSVGQWVREKEKQRVLRQIVTYCLTSMDGSEKNVLALADLYYQLGDPLAGVRYIKEGAQILYASGQREKAVRYHDYLLKGFMEKGVTRDDARDFLDTVLDKVRLTVSSLPTREAIPLIQKALDTAVRYKIRDRMIRLKIALIYKLQAAGDDADATEHLEALPELLDGIEDRRLFVSVTLAMCDILSRRGRFREAIERYENISRELDRHPYDESDLIAVATVANRYVLCGQIRRGMAMFEMVGVRAEALHLPNVVRHTAMMRLYSWLEMRKTDQAGAALEEVHGLIQHDSPNVHTSVGASFAEAYLCYARGDFQKALALHLKGVACAAEAGIETLIWGWGLEYLTGLERKGLLGKEVSVDAEIEALASMNHIYRKGIALRYRALRRAARKAPLARVLSDLDGGEALLEESGARIEAARIRLIRGKLFSEKGDVKTARFYFDQVFAFLSTLDKELFPEDLLAMMPMEAKVGVLMSRMAKIQQAQVSDPEGASYLDRMLQVALEFSMASRGALLSIEESRFRVIVHRNLETDLFVLDRFSACQQAILAAAAQGEELVVPGGDAAVNENFRDAQITSLIGIPLQLGGGASGYFLLGDPLDGAAHTESLLPFFRLISSQMALGLANIEAQKQIKSLKEQLESQVTVPRKQARKQTPISTIVGKSDSIVAVKDRVRQVARTDSSVLLLGETGVGKELAAKAIHQLSDRSGGPFVPVSIAALPQELAASELFGHEKGAFTGAHVQHRGRFELADGGTIFLDEIGELSIPLQVKLLRVLQEGTFERLGSSRPIRSDFRVIAATNKDLVSEMEKGAFREDLYYRLNVFPIQIPPIRGRRGDIPLLARHFIEGYARQMKKTVRISKTELKKLEEYHWPGNVRELKHFIEKAIIICDGGSLNFSGVAYSPERSALFSARRFDSLANMEKAYIEEVLSATGGRVKGPGGAAEILEMQPSTLYFRIKKLGIDKGGR